MSELKLKVKSTKQFVFNPNELMIRTIGADIENGTSQIYFELKESEIDNSRYDTREWVDKGNVTVPISILAGARNEDGTLNIGVINAFLSVFNLEIDTTPSE